MKNIAGQERSRQLLLFSCFLRLEFFVKPAEKKAVGKRKDRAENNLGCDHKIEKARKPLVPIEHISEEKFNKRACKYANKTDKKNIKGVPSEKIDGEKPRSGAKDEVK